MGISQFDSWPLTSPFSPPGSRTLYKHVLFSAVTRWLGGWVAMPTLRTLLSAFSLFVGKWLIMLWYYARIYGRVRFAPRWLFLCVDSARADHTWPGRGEMFSACRLQVSRVLQIWPSQSPFPPCRIGSSASLHKRRSKRLRALSECQLGGRFPFF